MVIRFWFFICSCLFFSKILLALILSFGVAAGTAAIAWLLDPAIEKIFVDQDVVSSDSLFVDDIFDSGKTFSNVLSKATDSSKLTFATLFARRGVSYPEQLIYGCLLYTSPSPRD